MPAWTRGRLTDWHRLYPGRVVDLTLGRDGLWRDVKTGAPVSHDRQTIADAAIAAPLKSLALEAMSDRHPGDEDPSA